MLKTRRKGFKEPKSILLIVCEDTKSSFYYLSGKVADCGLFPTAHLKKVSGSGHAVDVKSSKHSAPISVVQYAINERDRYNTQAKKEGRYPYREIYCVMDVDDHSSLEEALNSITEENSVNNDKGDRDNRNSKLIPIISNECFEIWYILHFEYTTGALHRPTKQTNIPDNRRIDKILAKYLDYRKANSDIYNKLKGKESYALDNAEKLAKEQDETRSEKQPLYKCNPYTDVYKLINRLNVMGRSLRSVNPNEIKEITLEYLETVGISFSKEDEFVQALLQRINQHYPNETQKGKQELLIDMLQNDHNTVCNENQGTIAPYFYQNYYQWKKSIYYRDLTR